MKKRKINCFLTIFINVLTKYILLLLLTPKQKQTTKNFSAKSLHKILQKKLSKNSTQLFLQQTIHCLHQILIKLYKTKTLHKILDKKSLQKTTLYKILLKTHTKLHISIKCHGVTPLHSVTHNSKTKLSKNKIK